MVEQSAVNRWVVGSSPTRGAFNKKREESKKEVVRSKRIRPDGQAVKTRPFHGCNPGSIPGRVTLAPSPSGKAKVCNTSTPGSNPGGAFY